MEVEVEDNAWTAASEGAIQRTLNFIGTGPPDLRDENGYTPLMAACAYGQLELVNELLRRGANPNLKDNDGNSALHHCDYSDCLRVLIAADGKVLVRNNDGEMPIDMKREDLADAEQEFSDDEEEQEVPSTGRGESQEQRLKALVAMLTEAGVQEETLRKKTRS